jgi:hypothetical protein
VWVYSRSLSRCPTHRSKADVHGTTVGSAVTVACEDDRSTPEERPVQEDLREVTENTGLRISNSVRRASKRRLRARCKIN